MILMIVIYLYYLIDDNNIKNNGNGNTNLK